MTTMLVTQLDYIYFAYGLVLFLLGAVCFSMSRSAGIPTPWPLLGAFAVLHGLAEWLHLVALTGGDSPGFGLARDLLTMASFLCLLEFARQSQEVVKGRTPGRWILLPPAAVIALAVGFGPETLVSAVQPLVAAPAIFWTAWLFLYAARHGEELGGGQDAYRARLLASIYFTVFGLVSGLVVPKAPFLPPGWPSAEALLATTGIPVQLLGAVTVTMMALSVWALAAASDKNLRVASKRRLLFWVTAGAVTGMLAGGALFTNWLGRLHDADSVKEAESAAAMVNDHLATEMEWTAQSARILSGLVGQFHAAGGLGGEGGGQARLDALVDSVSTTSDGWVAYVLDPSGTTIAASNRFTPSSLVGKNFAVRPYFQSALEGRSGRFLGKGLVTGAPGYYASEPVYGSDDRLLAVAVVKRTLGAEQLGNARAGSSYLVDGRGQVMTASRTAEPRLRLWEEPIAAGGAAGDASLATPLAPATGPALFTRPVSGTEWVEIGGRQSVAIRHLIPGSDWSLLMVRPEQNHVINRLLGIVITLLFSLLVLATFMAMQRQLGAESWMADQRQEAESRARDSARQADSDALTGVLNRLGFEAALGNELERSRRYGLPLSVVMIDLDHFKRVNDTWGHGAGDQVLVGVARIVETNVRDSDSVGRLGGEEFMVLAPGTSGFGAIQLAEKLRALVAATPLGPAGLVTGSFGVAELRPGETAEALQARADQALYAAKNGGRNRVICEGVDVAEVLAAPRQEVAPVRPMLAGSSIFAATGFDPIDAEHRPLSEAIDALLTMLSTARTEEVQVGFESVLDATAAHFVHEEGLMRAHGYPGLERHRREHLKFVEEAGRLLADLEQGGVSVPFRRWTMVRLPEWFRLHILHHDLELGAFLAKADPMHQPQAASNG